MLFGSDGTPTRSDELPGTAHAVQVWVLVFPGFQLLDATGPLQVFGTAHEVLASRENRAAYSMHLVSLHGGEIKSAHGPSMNTAPLPEPSALANAVLVVAGGIGIEEACGSRHLVAWVARASAQVTKCCAVCSGAFLLGQAGVLDGRKATTHWRYLNLLRARFPTVHVEDNEMHVRDGNVYTSAGVTAGIDLCLNLVEEDYGYLLSLAVAKRLVVYLKRQGGQRQFSSELMAQLGDETLAGELLRWLVPRLQDVINVESMAAALSVSYRTLHRRLQEDIGTTPARFLSKLRLEFACRLLESSTFSVKQIAKKSGFGTEYNLRRCFMQILSVTPTDYRERFSR